MTRNRNEQGRRWCAVAGLLAFVSVTSVPVAFAADPVATPPTQVPQVPADPAGPPAPAAGYPPAPTAGYPPPAWGSPASAPGYPPPSYRYPPQVAQSRERPPVEVVPRRLAFKANFGVGVFDPSDVNKYIKAQVPDNVIMLQGFSEMRMLLSFDASAAYFPVRFLGIRPNLLYLFAPKVLTISGGTNQAYWLHSLAPGLAVDLVIDTGKVARFFASPGVAYQFGWFEGYGARGVALELAIGTELSFGRRRTKGISLALALRSANLDVSSSPASPTTTTPVDSLDFSAVMFRVGFQMGG